MKKGLSLLSIAFLFSLASCSAAAKDTISIVDTTTKTITVAETTTALETTTETTIETTTTELPTTTTVIGEKGTITNPYTVSEAIEIIGTNSNISTEKIYVTGVVQSSPFYNQQYQSYSSYITDDSGKTVQVYSGTIDINAGKSDIKEGDKVIAYGYYMYYQKNSQPELAGDKSHDYPIYVKVERNTSTTPQTNTYETKEDNGKETISTTIEFNEVNMALEYDNDYMTWKKDNITLQFDEGTQYSWTMNVPYRFYVGTYMHIRSTSSIKYILFETENNYPFYVEMPVTNGQMEVLGNSTYIYAKTGSNYIKIHNSNKGEVKNVKVKQARITKMTVVSYK